MTDIVVEVDANFTGFTIGSLAAGEAYLYSETKNYTRPADADEWFNFTAAVLSLSGVSRGTSNTLQMILPVDPATKGTLHVVDLVHAISDGFSMITSWFANLSPSFSPTITLERTVGSDFILTIGQTSGIGLTKVVGTNFIVDFTKDITSMFSGLWQWGATLESVFSSSIVMVVDIKHYHAILVDLVQSISTVWEVLPSWDAVLNIDSSITNEFSAVLSWIASVEMPQTSSIDLVMSPPKSDIIVTLSKEITSAYLAMVGWFANLTPTVSPSISLSEIAESDFSLIIGQTSNIGLTKLLGSDFIIGLTKDITSVFSSLWQWGAVLMPTYSTSVTLTKTIGSDFILNIEQTSGLGLTKIVGTDFIIDFAEDITSVFSGLWQWSSVLDLSKTVGIGITQLVESDFILTFDSSITSSWTALAGSDIVITLQKTINNAFLMITQWAVNITPTYSTDVSLTQLTGTDFMLTVDTSATTSWVMEIGSTFSILVDNPVITTLEKSLRSDFVLTFSHAVTALIELPYVYWKPAPLYGSPSTAIYTPYAVFLMASVGLDIQTLNYILMNQMVLRPTINIVSMADTPQDISVFWLIQGVDVEQSGNMTMSIMPNERKDVDILVTVPVISFAQPFVTKQYNLTIWFEYPAQFGMREVTETMTIPIAVDASYELIRMFVLIILGLIVIILAIKAIQKFTEHYEVVVER